MNRLHIFSALTLLLPLLSGCGLYSGYERPAIGYDAEHMCLPDSVCSPLAAMSWRELFTDEYLSAWIDSGLNSNTDLRIAALKVEEARATLSASRLAFLPSVSMGADGSVGSGSSDRFSIGPSASWEIDAFGKQRNLKMGAEASWFASQAYRQAVQSQLVATIADGYYTLLMLDEQLSISERTLTTWDENIRVLQARANRMRVESSTLTLRNQIAEQENAIRSLLLDPDADMARGSLREQSFPESLSAGIPIDLLSNRPDVREAEYRLQKSFYDINVARAAFYPSITLSGNAGWTTSSGSVGNPSSWIANALGSVVVPIFNRGTNKANLDIARARYEENLLDFQQKLLDAGMEVNNALIAWQTANGRLALDRKQIVALKGAVHNTRLLMRNTTTNYLEVLTAQQRLLEAELSEASDRFDVIRSVISLYHALGGGR